MSGRMRLHNDRSCRQHHLCATFREGLAPAYREAERIMRDRASSFYQAFRVMSEADFMDIAAVYAFCRHADDVVDDAAMDPDAVRERLSELESDLDRLGSGLESVTSLALPWWPAFCDTVRRRGVPKGALILQIEGQRSDLDFRDCRLGSDLIEYARRVAGSVGRMLAPMVGACSAVSRLRAAESSWTAESSPDAVSSPDDDFELICERLGIAMQITNILRDVGEDLRLRDRLYLPLETLAAHGVTREELVVLARSESAPEVHSAVRSLWEDLAGLAEAYYDSVFRHADRFHPDARVPVVAAGIYYRAILDAVRRNAYNCYTQRCFVDDGEKAALMRIVLDMVGMS